MLASLRAVVSSHWSITGRLTRHFFLSSALLLLAVGALLYFGLSRSLLAQDRALIASKARVLRVLLDQSQENLLALRSEVEHEAGEEGGLRYFLRVLAPDGRTLLETPGMDAVLSPAAFAGLGEDAEPRALASGARYLLASERLRDGRQLHLALDMEHNYEVLDAYRRQLFVVVLGGVLVAGLAGAVIVRRGLRPLVLIARAAQHVTASRLQARVSTTKWPTELEALAREFDRMLDRLEDSFRRLHECTGDMAHALRNPINNLRGEAEVALSRARSPEEYQHALASSLEEYDRLARMIDALLFIARADEATTAVERRTFEVRAEMEAVREFYDALAAERGVRVSCEGAATLHADSMLVRRAVSNLLANALKHTPAGGAITLAVQTRPDGTVEISATDTGVGIPEEHLGRVFERFYQVDKTRDQGSKGAGLGLAIVQSIMRLHGGSASLISQLGHGTRVTLLFPGN
jgi:two-component system heavy metal sensor histidine kinase CusS